MNQPVAFTCSTCLDHFQRVWSDWPLQTRNTPQELQLWICASNFAVNMVPLSSCSKYLCCWFFFQYLMITCTRIMSSKKLVFQSELVSLQLASGQTTLQPSYFPYLSTVKIWCNHPTDCTRMTKLFAISCPLETLNVNQMQDKTLPVWPQWWTYSDISHVWHMCNTVHLSSSPSIWLKHPEVNCSSPLLYNKSL